jgi:hypothetical protein
MLGEGRTAPAARETSMSMYTQLLSAALRQRSVGGSDEEGTAVAEVRRCRIELEHGRPAVDEDTVSAALALQIGYDVALLRLAGVIGIDSDPTRFDRPQHERGRLEGALAARGIAFDEPSGQAAAADRTNDSAAETR